VVPIAAPILDGGTGIEAVGFTVEELGPLTFNAGPLSAQIDNMSRQRGAPGRPLPKMTRDQCLDDDPLPDIEPKGSAGPVLRRPQRSRPIPQGEASRRRQTNEHGGADVAQVAFEPPGQLDLQAVGVGVRCLRQKLFKSVTHQHRHLHPLPPATTRFRDLPQVVRASPSAA